MTRAFTCPEGALAAEIEFAIAYTVACNWDRIGELLLTPPRGCREQFADQITAMLIERAGKGLSGMALTEEDADVQARKYVNRE